MRMSLKYYRRIPSSIVIVIELMMILKDVTTIAEIISPRKIPAAESPLA